MPERRSYHRFATRSLGTVSFHSAAAKDLPAALPVKNISYGGVLLSLADVSREDQQRQFGGAEAVVGTVSILDQTFPFSGRLLRAQPMTLAVQFAHNTPVLLIALRPIIEHIRWGSTLTQIHADLLKDRYQVPGNLCLRGDGPTDMTLKIVQDDVESALLTFRDREHYLDVSYRDGVLRTGKSLLENGPSSRVVSDQEFNRDTLRMALWILGGIEVAALAETTMPLYQLVLNAFSSGTKGIKAPAA